LFEQVLFPRKNDTEFGPLEHIFPILVTYNSKERSPTEHP